MTEESLHGEKETLLVKWIQN